MVEISSVSNIFWYICRYKDTFYLRIAPYIIGTDYYFFVISTDLCVVEDVLRYKTNKKNDMSKLTPAVVFDCFAEICEVPRPSKKEEKIQAYLEAFAERFGLEKKVDHVGNVIIIKPATPGYEDRKTVVLQSHMDMVCEKNNDVAFDFENDPIQTEVRGEWLHAKGTTLGADDGIGMALALAILRSNDLEHGRIEALFTKDEETGLTGANELQPGFIEGDILINLDSEDEGEIFVSCAGGAGTTAVYTLPRVATPADTTALRLVVNGLTGGHSGDDIDKMRANANKLLLRYLDAGVSQHGLLLADIQAGGLHNAIPREATAVVVVPTAQVEALRTSFEAITASISEAYSVTEPNFKFAAEAVTAPAEVFATAEATRMIKSLVAVHHGIYAMSQTMPGLVETSSNLASIRANGNEVKAITSQRSAINSERRQMSAVVRAAFELGGAVATTSDGYPGWKFNPESQILQVAVESYKRLFGKEPVVRAIHAGLECGLFGEKYPQLDMISVGPTLRGVHSPDERLLIPTVQLVWDHLLDILKHVPAK